MKISVVHEVSSAEFTVVKWMVTSPTMSQVKEFGAATRLNYTQLSALVGVKPTTWSDYATGRRKMPASTWVAANAHWYVALSGLELRNPDVAKTIETKDRLGRALDTEFVKPEQENKFLAAVKFQYEQVIDAEEFEFNSLYDAFQRAVAECIQNAPEYEEKCRKIETKAYNLKCKVRG